MSKQSDKSDKTKEKDKTLEKAQTTEKPQVNQSHTTYSFLKGIENKKKEAQVQIIEKLLEPEAFQANPTKTPIMTQRENIVNDNLENENENEKNSDPNRCRKATIGIWS